MGLECFRQWRLARNDFRQGVLPAMVMVGLVVLPSVSESLDQGRFASGAGLSFMA